MTDFPLRLATRKNGTRDGELMLVSPDARRWAPAAGPARTLQALLDDWAALAPALDQQRRGLDASGWAAAAPFEASACMAPLPRAFQWADASVYRNHARLIYQWRQEPIPPRYEEEPLVYQGGSDGMIGPEDPIVAVDEAHQIDLEAEIAVVTTDVPMGTTAAQAGGCTVLTEGFKAAVQWRDSGKPIPEGDEARALVREMEDKISRHPRGGGDPALPPGVHEGGSPGFPPPRE